MTKENLLDQVSSLQDENKLSFFIGNLNVTNRFDVDDIHQFEEGDVVTDISFLIYSLIANAIFFKAQEKDVVKQGFNLYQKQFSSYKESEVALNSLYHFLYKTQKVTLTQFVDSMLPLGVAIEKKATKKRGLDKIALKNKEIITNQVTLFVRSLNHTYLTNNIDPKKITPDYDDLTNGIFLYDNKNIVIPTWQNAFTLNAFKKVCYQSLQKLTNALDFSSVNSITVLYFSKDIGAKYTF